MQYYTADYILPISAPPIKNGVIVIDAEGVIRKVGTRDDFPSADLQHYKGILLPGLINTHCHLELSHMQGACPTGTKLIQFITNVVQLREYEQEVILQHIKEKDEAMWAAGIQAVGDISNKVDTAQQKALSPISYYTFVECFDMMQPEMTVGTIENYREVFTAQARGEGNKKSFVPHAPYSVTKELFYFLNKANPDKATISIHNTETADENLLFQDGSGGFAEFYKNLGMSLDHFRAPGTNSIEYVLENWTPKRRNIFVHNTLTSAEDITRAHNWSDTVYWATCPNANMYIENNLPNYKLFLAADAKMTIGTDSIMSNWQLDVWEELKTIKKMQSYVPLHSLLQWATINGAEALGYASTMGSLEVGKRPGIVSVDVEWLGEETILSGSAARRIY